MPPVRLLLRLALVCIATVSPVNAQERRPNVLLIAADDLGYAEMSCQGAKDISTPNLDALAANGVRFTSGYVTAPYCSPSRAGFLTGRMQTRFGHELNYIGKINLEERAGLPLSEKTFADHLKSAGYRTGLVGKWHLGGIPEHHPLKRGFDEFYGFLHEGHFYVPGPPWRGVTSFLRKKDADGRITEGDVIWSSHTKGDEHPYDENNPVMRGTDPIVEERNLTDAFASEAGEFIARHQDKPWFLYLSFNAPHSPMQAPTKWMEKFAHIEDMHRRVFAAMTGNLDHAIGEVMARLRETGQEERTLVLFISDHGGPTRELTSSNAPFRGGKGELYEGGIRVPFIVQWKGKDKGGRVIDVPVSSLDLLPTALSAARAPASREARLDGVDLLPLLRGESETLPGRPLFWRYKNSTAIRDGRWKLVRQAPYGKPAPPFALYDLVNDLAESRDLAQEQPEIRAALEAKLNAIDAEMVPAR